MTKRAIWVMNRFSQLLYFPKSLHCLIFIGFLINLSSLYQGKINKFVLFLPAIFILFEVTFRHLRFSISSLPIIIAFIILSAPGLINAEYIGSALLYFFMFALNFLVLTGRFAPTAIAKAAQLRYVVFLYIVFTLVYLSTGGLFFIGLQPSISDMLLLSMSGFLLIDFSNDLRRYKNHLLILTFCMILYGYVVESRLIAGAPFLFFILRFFVLRFGSILPSILRFSCFVLFVSLVLIVYVVPEEVFLMRGSLTDLGSVTTSEVKRLSLLLNGFSVLRDSNFLGAGFGASNYASAASMNTLGITPQFLPLTVAVYGGIFCSLLFCIMLFEWVGRGPSASNVAARLMLLMFIMVHEYVFNPFFGLSCLLLSQGQVFSNDSRKR